MEKAHDIDCGEGLFLGTLRGPEESEGVTKKVENSGIEELAGLANLFGRN